MKLKIQSFIIIGFMLLLSLQCYYNSELMECNYTQGLFIQGTHYIPATFITEAGDINYEHLFQEYDKQKNSIPSENCLSFDE